MTKGTLSGPPPMMSIGQVREMLNGFDDDEVVMLLANADGGVGGIALVEADGEMTIGVWLSAKRYKRAEKERRERKKREMDG